VFTNWITICAAVHQSESFVYHPPVDVMFRIASREFGRQWSVGFWDKKCTRSCSVCLPFGGVLSIDTVPYFTDFNTQRCKHYHYTCSPTISWLTTVCLIRTTARSRLWNNVVCFRRVLPSRVNALGYLRKRQTTPFRNIHPWKQG
jgi:hypothetical protein